MEKHINKTTRIIDFLLWQYYKYESFISALEYTIEFCWGHEILLYWTLSKHITLIVLQTTVLLLIGDAIIKQDHHHRVNQYYKNGLDQIPDTNNRWIS